MFRIENEKDLKLVSRAIRCGWSYDRSKVTAALEEIIEQRDPDLILGAAALLLKGDEVAIKAEEAAIKRELMEIKKIGDEQQLRLRLLELARNIEPTELARLASKNGITDKRD